MIFPVSETMLCTECVCACVCVVNHCSSVQGNIVLANRLLQHALVVVFGLMFLLRILCVHSMYVQV